MKVLAGWSLIAFPLLRSHAFRHPTLIQTGTITMSKRATMTTTTTTTTTAGSLQQLHAMKKKKSEITEQGMGDSSASEISVDATASLAIEGSQAGSSTADVSLLKKLIGFTHGSWHECLQRELTKPYVEPLDTFLQAERAANKNIYPEPANVFAALNLCPLEEVKVVIIGQDPYHGPGQAHGLAFSVLPGVPVPPSLVNIYKELAEDEKVSFTRPRHGYLAAWAKQGVLLLNTCLTVRKGEANSHQKQGWERLTDAIVLEVAKTSGVVYLLWGKPAQSKCKSIDGKNNCVIQTPHPSPLSAHRGFLGSRCFSQCNEYLVANGKEPIDWALPHEL